MKCFKRIAVVPASTLGICFISNPVIASSSILASSSLDMITSAHVLTHGENTIAPLGETKEQLVLAVPSLAHPETLGIEHAQLPRPNQEHLPLPEPLTSDDEDTVPTQLEEEDLHLPEESSSDSSGENEDSTEGLSSEDSDLNSPEVLDENTSDNDFNSDRTLGIEVQSIEVLGSSIFDDEDFAPITEPIEGTTATLEDLQQVADSITQLYLDEGYLTSRAILVDQTITNGAVRIQVVEGQISEIQIDGNERLRDSYIHNRIELGTDPPLRIDRLEDQLRLLRSDPLIDNIEASLRAGDKLGESLLVVRVVEANAFIGNIYSDNYSPPSIGSERIGMTLGYGNVTGRGDAFVLDYNRTAQGGSNIVDVNYRIPVNPMNGTVRVRALIDRNEVIQEPFDVLEIEGESERYELTFRQPLVRSPREEFALSFGFAYRDGEVLAFDLIPLSIGANDAGVTRTSVFRFGQDYVKRDVGGAWALRSQFSIGTGILNATTNDGLPDSRFFAWLGQVQRVQRLGDDHLLVAQLDFQMTPDALLSSEQFVIGGGQSLRGFRQNVRAGDNGIRFSLEDRITLRRNESGVSTVQLAPFVDMGVVWNDSDNFELPDQNFLAGIGAGILWEVFPNFDVRLDFAIPLVDLDDRGENMQNDGIYFSVNYSL